MNRSPPYYNGIMHHREWQGVSARWFVIKITPQSSLLKTDICGQRRQWTGGGWVRWLTGWQNHPIPGFVPQSRVQLHPRLTLGKPRPTLRQMNFGRFVGLGYNITTLQLKYCPQGRAHNGDWKWIVAIRSNCSIHSNYRHRLLGHGGLEGRTSNFLRRITIPTCSRLCCW